MFTRAGQPRSVQMSTPRPQEVRASANWVRITPRKARLVVEHIRGRTVPEARTVLAFTQRAAAREVEKLLRSAVSNAEANHGLIGDDLVVKAAYVDEGPLRRPSPRPRQKPSRRRSQRPRQRRIRLLQRRKRATLNGSKGPSRRD